MLFRVAEKTEIKTLYDMLAEKNAVVGPVRTGTDRKGAPLYAFEQVADYGKMTSATPPRGSLPSGTSSPSARTWPPSP